MEYYIFVDNILTDNILAGSILTGNILAGSILTGNIFSGKRCAYRVSPGLRIKKLQANAQIDRPKIIQNGER